MNNIYGLEYLQQLFNNRSQYLYPKIEILNWDENYTLYEITGKIIECNINIVGDSASQRSLTLSMVAENGMMEIQDLYGQKICFSIGISNDDNSSIIWFPMGVYVITNSSISMSSGNINISLQARDKMCLLDGNISGFFPAPTRLDVNNNNEKILIYDLIYQIVTEFGCEKKNVIINDVPLKYKQLVQYKGINNYEFVKNNQTYILKQNDYAGYKLIDYVYFGELIANAGDSVYSVLQKIAEYMGDYEFFYDINGNFIFRRKPNFLMQAFTPLEQQNQNIYIADFNKSPVVYSFKNNPNTIISYNNNFNYSNIKNDFIVWGQSDNGNIIQYHIVIDEKPLLPPGYEHPYQQYIIDNNLFPDKYYNELQAKFPQIYDRANKKFKSSINDFNYWFEIIDSNSEIGKFSISKIGRRQKVISDNNITTLFPLEVPDIVIVPQGTNINEYLAQGIEPIIVNEQEYYNLFTEVSHKKDAFTVIRELLYYNSNFNDTITISTIPIYTLEPNQCIEVQEDKMNIYGHYIINSIDYSINNMGANMNITATKVYNRI